ncbi:uncharacterized protein LOC142224819 [Haematobia irritans]|uniref:uncharacterized protein LOC142224819 n=1 Tax=Haematobia irritans TaxID=7368 RepID=UPI003F50703B
MNWFTHFMVNMEMNTVNIALVILLCMPYSASSDIYKDFVYNVYNYIFNMVVTSHKVLFACNNKDSKNFIDYLMAFNVFMELHDTRRSFNLELLLTHKANANISIHVDCNCTNAVPLLSRASDASLFNKTYNWVVWDKNNACLNNLLSSKFKYFGPNAQLLVVAMENSTYRVFDCHSKGRHLGAPVEISEIVTFNDKRQAAILSESITKMMYMRSIYYRGNFNGLILRGAAVMCVRDTIESRVNCE